jgi:hypothetical protein
MAATFGIFWTTEGLGFEWPLADAILPLIAGWVAIVSYVCVLWLKRAAKTSSGLKLRSSGKDSVSSSKVVKALKTVVEFIKEFVIADEWITACVLWVIVILGSLITYSPELWPLVLVYFTVLLPFGLRMNLTLEN